MKSSLSTLVFACVIAAGFSSTQAADVVIDDFTVAQSGSGSVDGAGILGGERDAIVNGGNVLSISGGSAAMSLPLDQMGAFIILSYDGEDNSSGTNYFLGDVDLTDGGSNGSFFLNVTSVSGTVQCRIYAAEGPEEFAVLDFEIDHTGLYQIPLESLVAGDPPMVFIAINRIDLRMIMDPGESITINQFRVGPTLNPLVFEDGFESE